VTVLSAKIHPTKQPQKIRACLSNQFPTASGATLKRIQTRIAGVGFSYRHTKWRQTLLETAWNINELTDFLGREILADAAGATEADAIQPHTARVNAWASRRHIVPASIHIDPPQAAVYPARLRMGP
jgi:hypothetical protein